MILPEIHSDYGTVHYKPAGFSIHAHRNTLHRRHGPNAYAKSVRKYKIGPTNHTPFFFDEIAAWPDNRMAIVQAEDIHNDSEYACPITVGSPGVTLILDFDTGSSDFWVRSSEFEQTVRKLKAIVCTPPTKVEPLNEFQKPAVGVSQHLSDEFLKDGSDGLLGLAFPKLNTVKPYQQKTPMQNMVEQGLIKDAIADFYRQARQHDSHGFYTFGYISEHIHASKLYWQDVISDNGGGKVCGLPYVKIGHNIYDRGHLNTAIIDTGTTLILMDDRTVENLYSQIPGAKLDRTLGGYIFPTDACVPKLAFSIGKWLFTIPSEDLAFSDAGDGMAYGAIQSRGQNKQDILGTCS
ncbi:aspartyl protease [Rhizoctonia solani]|uniref:Aspartyl protease n=1 Tax=Rhizoctonia solani TaxID=456999 RepID=A0A8H8P303_9AGAM|nr:aspartyl protease [Rhizoctonia solani]QRW22986.1 aspartyl protease [Rhizoctonia solani]